MSETEQKPQSSIEAVKPENTGSVQGIVRNEKGQFVPGVSGNPAGKRPGAENFKTKWLKFIDKIAAQNNITPDEVDEQLLAVAFKQMKSGDFRYWKDIQDRVYGMAKQPIEHLGKLTISQVLDQLEDGQKTSGQELATEPLVQDQEQAGQDGAVQAQPSASTLSSE